ncbi:ABC transporter permease [Couchioplanes caeruleus]|uniref:ABC transporter permease n=1 Tax=Couchioplanes caeruleus TaxID=56438 RepID=UPI0020C0A2FE|nr:ABC transporter permease [Couchioplanes caeruleus]UQU62455.1 ABC transporter permease [Couchioplanes caeruleus]
MTRTAGTRPPGLGAALGWEVVKLAAQVRSRALLAAALIVPVVVVLVLDGQQQPPSDTIYGRHIHDSGYAVPLLMLAFAAQWVLPLLAAVVAGDIFAGEDQHGTWKTLLTRSVSRTQVFWAKALTAAGYNLLVLTVFAGSTTGAGLLIVGTQPLTGLGGQSIASATALRLILAAWATAIPPILGFTALALLLSVRTRNPALGIAAPVVLGFAMQLLGSVSGLDLTRKLLLTTPFEAWHGLFAARPFTGPLTTGLAVSAGWTVLCLAGAYLSLRRRDITGG